MVCVYLELSAFIFLEYFQYDFSVFNEGIFELLVMSSWGDQIKSLEATYLSFNQLSLSYESDIFHWGFCFPYSIFTILCNLKPGNEVKHQLSMRPLWFFYGTRLVFKIQSPLSTWSRGRRESLTLVYRLSKKRESKNMMVMES